MTPEKYTEKVEALLIHEDCEMEAEGIRIEEIGEKKFSELLFERTIQKYGKALGRGRECCTPQRLGSM